MIHGALVRDYSHKIVNQDYAIDRQRVKSWGWKEESLLDRAVAVAKEVSQDPHNYGYMVRLPKEMLRSIQKDPRSWRYALKPSVRNPALAVMVLQDKRVIEGI